MRWPECYVSLRIGFVSEMFLERPLSVPDRSRTLFCKLHPGLKKDAEFWAVTDFFADLKEHNAGDGLIMVLFTVFGRRGRDKGTGTGNGAGGVAFVIGDRVRNGMQARTHSSSPKACKKVTWLPTMTSDRPLGPLLHQLHFHQRA